MRSTEAEGSGAAGPRKNFKVFECQNQFFQGKTSISQHFRCKDLSLVGTPIRAQHRCIMYLHMTGTFATCTFFVLQKDSANTKSSACARFAPKRSRARPPALQNKRPTVAGGESEAASGGRGFTKQGVRGPQAPEVFLGF